MKKLLIGLILFGCAQTTTYIPTTVSPKITEFDKEVLNEYNLQYAQLDSCGKFYVTEFSYIFYMIMRDTTTTWKVCGKELNSEQKKIWSKYWGMFGWNIFYPQREEFCKAKKTLEDNKIDPEIFAGQAATITAIYLTLSMGFDACSHDPDIKNGKGM
jgi:hypothetical protein